MGGKRPGGKRHGGQKVGGQKVGGQKTGGQKTGGQKTGGQKSCHHFDCIFSFEYFDPYDHYAACWVTLMVMQWPVS